MTEKNTFPVNNNKVKRYLSMIYPLVVTQNTQREFKLKNKTWPRPISSKSTTILDSQKSSGIIVPKKLTLAL